MDYQQKYKKYKTKYNQLKYNLLRGGDVKVLINGTEITNSKMTLLNYDTTNNILGGIKDVDDKNIELVAENPIQQTSKYKYELIQLTESMLKKHLGSNLLDENILKISSIDSSKPYFMIELSREYKLYCIIFKHNEHKYQFIYYSKLIDLEEKNYFINKTDKTYDFVLTIDDKFNIEGKCIIKKSTKRIKDGKPLNEIVFNIYKINNTNCNIIDIIDLPSLYISSFDFQKSYDKLKEQKNYCPESTILYKHIYNTFLTNKMIENYEFYKYLQDNFGNLLEQTIFNDIRKNNNDISHICSTSEKRINLLNNVMKRINTDHKTGILIKDGSGKFIKIDNYGLNVIFDTGNASITLISENIVPILGLKQKKDLHLK